MNDFLTGLNERQQQAVKITEGPLLVVAGAGSGKTRMLTARIAYLVEDCNKDPKSILAVTFTNKAAREMRERVRGIVPHAADAITLTTFHSFCCRLLRRWHKHIGFEDGFTIYDEDDSSKLMKSVLKESGLDPKHNSPKKILALISEAKNELVAPDGYVEFRDGDTRAEQIAKLYENYQQKLQKNQAVDFDDLIYKTFVLLDKNPELLSRLQDQYKYFLVDEYQDTNHVQYRLISLISSKTNNLCVVGDEDQSIYSWRGATIRNIRDFEEDFAGAKIVKLEQNYRSTQTILDASGAVISKNASAHGKILWTDRGDGDLVVFSRCNDDRDEASWIVNKILQMQSNGRKLSDFAVLFRMNSLSRQLEQRLKQLNVPYDLIGGHKYFQRREVKDILAYLKVIDNLCDGISFERIINTPRRKIGKKMIEKLTAEGTRAIWEGIIEEGGGKPSSTVGKFLSLMLDLIEAADTLSVSELAKKVIDEVKYIEYIHNDDPDTAQAREDNVKALVSDIRAQEEDNSELSLHEYLESVALHSALDDVDEEDQTEKVQLLTLHNAKGLEFPVVFMVAMEEGIFPHHSSKESPEELEEERRLAYVGMTRAKDRLFMSATRRRMVFGAWNNNMVSRFITEVPQHLYEHGKKGDVSERRTATGSEKAYIPGAVVRDSRFGRPSFNQNAGAKWSPGSISKEINDSTGTENGTMLNLKLGVRVMHGVFGTGLIVKTEGDTLDDFRIVIDFASKGRKTLLLQYSKLRVIK